MGSEGVGHGQFRGPVGIDVDKQRGSGDIAISDFENHRIQVLVVNDYTPGPGYCINIKEKK